MTKDTLLELINSFNRAPGEYTSEELYEIGLAHKQLPRNERSWNLLASLVGWTGTSEAYRNFVNSRMRKEGILPKNTHQLSERTIEDVTLNDFAEAKKDLLIQQQKTRDEWQAYRRIIRDEARIDTLKELIQTSVLSVAKEIPFNTEESIYPIKNEPKEAILMISDLHIGVECNNFYNKYNLDIASKRLEKLTTDVINYCYINNVSDLNICNLGDLIHGIIHINARIEQEMDVVNQIIQASELLSRVLLKLSLYVPHVTYRSVSDNHSRAIADKNQAIEKENFSKLIDWYLQERLKDSNVDFIFDNIDDGIGKFELNNGKKIMFTHGHCDSINQVYQHFTGASQEFIDYMLLGHYHSEKMKTYNSSRVFVNGSIVGTEQYALSKRLFSKPSQTLLIFDRDNLINYSIDLDIK